MRYFLAIALLGSTLAFSAREALAGDNVDYVPPYQLTQGEPAVSPPVNPLTHEAIALLIIGSSDLLQSARMSEPPAGPGESVAGGGSTVTTPNGPYVKFRDDNKE